MGARGKLAEFPIVMEISLSPAHKYMLESLARRYGTSQAGVVRQLIDEKWEVEGNGCEASEDGAEAGE